jgi:hypothetical protein
MFLSQVRKLRNIRWVLKLLGHSSVRPRNISVQFMNPSCFFVLPRSPCSSAPCCLRPHTCHSGSPLPMRPPPRLYPGRPRPTLPQPGPACLDRAPPGHARWTRLIPPSSTRRLPGPGRAPPGPTSPASAAPRPAARAGCRPRPIPVAPHPAARVGRGPCPTQQPAKNTMDQ